ncbi:MAG: S8 family serine peptidase [Candidatus Poribacteria bacterium]
MALAFVLAAQAFAASRVIVTLSPGSALTQALKSSLETEFGVTYGGQLRSLPILAATVPDGVDPAVIAARMGAVRVELDARRNHIPERGITTPKMRDAGRGHTATGQVVPWGVQQIGAEYAYASGFTGAGVNVAVVDTGIDSTHPDLAANVIGGYNAIDGGSPEDDEGHGTSVAGVIAAVDNDIDVVGVAPNVNLFSVKVLDSGGFGYDFDLIAGIDWCIQNGIDVINMSIGGYESTTALADIMAAASDAGIVLVAAAGNTMLGPVDFPGAYPEVIAVSATDEFQQLADFSAVGPEVDIAAPGADVFTTSFFGGADFTSGTSFSSPHVAGVVALMIEAGRVVHTGFGIQFGDDLLAFDTDLFTEEEGEGIVSAAASVGLPTVFGVRAPVNEEALPPWTASTTLEIALANHTNGWAWRLDEPFPPSGPASANHVSAGESAVIGGLENGRVYTVHVALTDPVGDILNPYASAASSFSVGLFYVIGADALEPGGTDSDSFFLPIAEARDGVTLSSQDDGFSGPIDLGFVLDYWGETSDVYVNYNGTVSFGGPHVQPWASEFPVREGVTRVLGPYWTDIDTSVSPAPGNDGSNLVYVSERVQDGLRQFVVTWDGVLAWDGDPSAEATFQLAIREDGRIGMAWDEMGWTDGDYAAVGFSGSFPLVPAEGAEVETSRTPEIGATLANNHLFFRTDPSGRLVPAPLAPQVAILAPTPDEVLPGGESSALLQLEIRDHAGYWHWRLGEPFPDSGAIGGHAVSDADSTIIHDLQGGLTYTAHVALVDRDHKMLSPAVVDSVTFSVDVGPRVGVTVDDTSISFRTRRDGLWERWATRPDGSEDSSRRIAESSGNTSWSPDGRRIVFAASVGGNWDLYLAGADGGDVRRLTDAPSQERFPAWSPDGRMIAFMTNRDGNEEVYVLTLRDGSVTNVSNNPALDRAPDWSPDGQFILFHTRRHGDDDIYMVAIDGTSERLLTTDAAQDRAPAVSADGRWVAFESQRSGDWDIWILDLDEVEPPRPLTTDVGRNQGADWSPDGSRVCFMSDRSGNRDIWTIAADGTDIRQETFDVGIDDQPSWGPFPVGSATQMAIVPPENVRVGAEFTSDVVVRSAVGLVGFETDIVYNPDMLRFVGVEAGDFLTPGGDQFFSEGEDHPEDGVVRDVFGARYTTDSPETSVDGTGVLFRVTFVALDGGEAFLGLEDVILSDENGAEIPYQKALTELVIFDIAYDVNLDNVVDILDLALVARDFGRLSGVAGRTDLNRDGRVNILDLAVVAAHFGENIGTNAAPARLPAAGQASDISAWLRELRGVNNGSSQHARAITILEQLLSMVAPQRTALLPAYPNPFNPETWVPFDLRDEATVTVSIYDVAGNRIRQIELGHRAPGVYRTRDRAAYWDGRTDTGEITASGVYLVELRAGDYRETRRIVLMK